MKYSLAIFDLDGTLMDTTDGILTSVKNTIIAYSLPSLSEENLLTFIGPPVEYSFNKYYSLENDLLKDVTNYFRDDYSSKNLLKAVPYSGIFQLLKALSTEGVKCAVATYKREDYALKLLENFGFNEYMDVMYGADNEGKLKKKDIILKCIESCGISDLKNVVMIGDTTHDSSGAMDLGIDFIGVTYGFGFTSEDVNKYSFVGIANNPEEILKFIIKK